MATKPNEEQIDLMRQFFAADAPDLTNQQIAEKFSIQTFVVSDNLVNHGQGKWSLSSLQAMPAMLPGLKMMLDHDWDEVVKTIGVIFNARFLITDVIPPDWILNAGGEREENLKIVSKEGYATVEIDAYFRNEKTEVLENFAWGEWNWVSLGGFNYIDPSDYRCPECDIKLNDPSCPHYLKGSNLADKNAPLIGHYILPQIKSASEVSIVYKGMLPAVGLKSKRYYANAQR